jgi:hypothetical protein
VISKLREIDDDTVGALGPRFDLPKVATTALGILRTLMRRAEMRFPGGDPPTFAFSFDDEPRPFDDEAAGVIAGAFDECKRLSYDVTLFGCEVRFGPFMADLYLLGFDCLHGPVGNCVTEYDLDWNQLDPTPLMLVMMRQGMIDAIVGTPRDFLQKTLETLMASGIELETHDSDGDDLAIGIRFPHAAFGDGQGPLRICRYLHRVREDGEEDEG